MYCRRPKNQLIFSLIVNDQSQLPKRQSFSLSLNLLTLFTSTMTNCNRTRGNDDSSNGQSSRQRRRIHMNQDKQEDQLRQVVPTIIDISRRGRNSSGPNTNSSSRNRQLLLPGSAIPYRPMDIPSLLRISSTTMLDGSYDSFHTSVSTTPTAATGNVSSSLNHQALIRILDCALEICNELLTDPPNTIDIDESNHT